MPGSIEKAIPGSSGVRLPATMYGSSCVSSPMPWPVRWMKRSPYPAAVIDVAGGGVDRLGGDPGPDRARTAAIWAACSTA